MGCVCTVLHNKEAKRLQTSTLGEMKRSDWKKGIHSNTCRQARLMDNPIQKNSGDCLIGNQGLD